MSALLWVILAAAVIIPILVVWTTHNRLVRRRNRALEAWNGIYIQLKRRADLIPNLTAAVRGYVQHERDLLEQMARLRSEFLRIPADDKGKIADQSQAISTSLGRLLALSESYPDLKSSANFLRLQEDLVETEDQIAAAKRIYNSNVTAYNSSREQFPANLIANKSQFTRFPLFEEDRMLEAPPEVPKIEFESRRALNS